jgi:alkanesulfonate monooxygenase SsuD/methylene tetrahydromethanopterin reductase-like flavin-dependent oxidoreductase (luciferase family)
VGRGALGGAVVKAGLTLPIFDELADPRLLADLAAEAEEAGWDAAFVWDHVHYRPPVQAVTDAWTAMAAMAMQTSSVLLGPMVTPLARRRPHVLARQLVAIDRLSNGRVVLGVGLGLDASGGELSRFGEELDDRRRAGMYDEALDVVTALLSGEPVDHHGEHYTADATFLPTPTTGLVPIWCAARWPNRKPLRRAARHDGVFVIDIDSPDDLRRLVDVIAEERGDVDGFDVVIELAEGADPAPWEAAGATWWLTSFSAFTVTASDVRRRIAMRA